jgi:hypothetical protein
VALPELPVVSVTVKLVPAIALAGGLLMLLTTRSGLLDCPACNGDVPSPNRGIDDSGERLKQSAAKSVDTAKRRQWIAERDIETPFLRLRSWSRREIHANILRSF